MVNLLLLAVGIFLEPLPALYILAPFLAPVAVLLRHRPGPLRPDHGLQPGAGPDPPADRAGAVPGLEHRQGVERGRGGEVSVERLSIMILPWLAVSLVVLFLVTYLPSEVLASEPARLRPRRRPRASAAMLGWGVAYVPSAWLVEAWPPLIAAGARLTLAGRAAARRPGRSRAARCARGWARRRSAWLALTQTVLFYGATFWGIAHGGRGPGGGARQHGPALRGRAGGAVPRRAPGGAPVGRAWRSAWWGRRWWSGRGRSGRRSCRPSAAGGGGRGAAPGASARWSPPAACAGAADPLALAGWQMAAGRAALLALGGLRGGGRPEAAGRARAGAGASAWRCWARRCRWRSSTWPWRRAPAAEVSAWFFLVPGGGGADAPGRCSARRPSARAAGRAWSGSRAGLWLVLGGRGPRRGAVGRLARRRERPPPARRP